MRTTQKQSGFTLVEIAIVMVIIGLLLGGALKGQEMIENARTKRIKADFDQYVAAFYSYQDIYRALPGDNDDANAQHGGVNATGGNAGNNALNGTWDANSGTGETRLFWDHLRTAGLISGTGTDQPQNAFSGIVGVQNGIGGNATGNLTGMVMCFSNIAADIGRVIDIQYDDGVGNTGAIIGLTNSDVPADYTANSVHICLQL